MHATHWQRIPGSGIVHAGPCIVLDVIFHPDAAADYADIYDGRDATSGTKCYRIESADDSTVAVNLGSGILFGRGIYVAGIDAAVETTVAFIPLVSS